MCKRIFHILCLFVAGICSLQAEVVVLRTGQTVKGELLLNNDEVVILRKKDGTRFQYPKAEVVTIRMDKEEVVVQEDSVVLHREKKVALRMNLSMGAAFLPANNLYAPWATDVQVHAAVGTHNLLKTNVFLGGSVGYHMVVNKRVTYEWIPIQMTCTYPITVSHSSAHRPLVGCSLGYAIALDKDYAGGICGGIDVGWWYKLGESSSMSIALAAQWQQTKVWIVETINGLEYSNHIGCPIMTIALNASIHF